MQIKSDFLSLQLILSVVCEGASLFQVMQQPSFSNYNQQQSVAYDTRRRGGAAPKPADLHEINRSGCVILQCSPEQSEACWVKKIKIKKAEP